MEHLLQREICQMALWWEPKLGISRKKILNNGKKTLWQIIEMQLHLLRKSAYKDWTSGNQTADTENEKFPESKDCTLRPSVLGENEFYFRKKILLLGAFGQNRSPIQKMKVQINSYKHYAQRNVFNDRRNPTHSFGQSKIEFREKLLLLAF